MVAPGTDQQASQAIPDPKPDHQRPERPDFWDHRFRQGTTPWDAGGVPAQFAAFVQERSAAADGGRRALVPGCGSAYEAGLLDRLAWKTDALDFSAAAIEAARRSVPDFGGRLLCEDFFTFAADRPYDLIYERAFLCAIPRQLWPYYAPRSAALLAAGGLLAGYFFIDGTALKGPPFGISANALEAAMTPCFELLDDQPSVDAIGPFAGRERWMVWRRR